MRSSAQYCWNCQADQSQVGPPEWSAQPGSSGTCFPTTGLASESCKKLSFGRPVSQDKSKPMSLEEYMKSKTKEQMSGHTFRPSKKRKVGGKAEVNEVVTINIGLMKFVNDDLKPVWDKRLPINVPKTSNYHTILEKAIEKRKAFNRKFNTEKKHVLVYEDGSHTQLMPGGGDVFQLDNYKTEVGKDFKRITLYLCTTEDLNASQEAMHDKSDSQSSSIPDPLSLDGDLPQEYDSNFYRDEKVAREYQEELDKEADQEHDQKAVHLSREVLYISDEDICQPTFEEPPKTPEEVIMKLHGQVDNDSVDNFFLVIRRGISLPRLLSLWQRQAKERP